MSCTFTFSALQHRLDTICRRIIAFGEHTPYHVIRISHKCEALRMVFPCLEDAWQEHIVLSLDQFVTHIDENWSESSLLDVVLHMSADLLTLEDWITVRCIQLGVPMSTDSKLEQEADWQDRLVVAEDMLKQDVFVRECMQLRGSEGYTMMHVMQSILDGSRPTEPCRNPAFEILHELCASTRTFPFHPVGIAVHTIKNGSEAVSMRGRVLVTRGYLDSGQLITATAYEARAEKRFKREVLLWHQLSNHPFILPLLGITDPRETGVSKMVSQWCQNGNLAQYLRHPGASSVNRLKLLHQVCTGLSYLHEHIPVVIHANLKCANVLIQDDGSACLADMCLSSYSEARPGLKSARWTATELLKVIAEGLGEEDDNDDDEYTYTANENRHPHTKLHAASDIWSLGALILEALTGTVPYAHISDSTTVVTAVLAGERPVLPLRQEVVRYGLDDELWRLLCQCWESDPGRRPGLRRVRDVVGRLAKAWVGGY